jgi:hypothetical protein
MFRACVLAIGGVTDTVAKHHFEKNGVHLTTAFSISADSWQTYLERERKPTFFETLTNEICPITKKYYNTKTIERYESEEEALRGHKKWSKRIEIEAATGKQFKTENLESVWKIITESIPKEGMCFVR